MHKGKNKDDKFILKEYPENLVDENKSHDFMSLYERAHEELSLQQTKRDQLIALYLALFSFIIPFALSLESIPLVAKGLIFFVVGIIGVFFSLITVRYRIYKEIYWLCCETLTCIMNFKDGVLNKDIVQAVFYNSLSKKGTKYLAGEGEKKKWLSCRYFYKNLFSSETLHYLVIILLTSVFWGLGIFMALPCVLWICVVAGVALGLVVFVALLAFYFDGCKKVYAVLYDGKDSSFNKTFAKAWFLHIYLK